VVVGKVGTATVSQAELAAAKHGSDKVFDRLSLVSRVRAWQEQGLVVGLTNGCFDCLHAGHLSSLEQAKGQCDRLVVAINTDASVRKLKGPTRPIQDEATRSRVLAGLQVVDAVVLFPESTALPLVKALRPDVIAKEGYALAKISGLKLCEFLRRERGLCYHSLMPTNLYGPGDNYDIEHGHVLPTLIRKFETMKDVVPLWGTGSAIREFLHVDDLASACLFALSLDDPPDLMNVGSGEEVTIRDLAEAVKAATGSTARIEWDETKPDGTPRKLCDTSLIRSLGWSPKICLTDGLRQTVASYRAELAAGIIRL